jgi:hypothetical protein
MICSGIKRDFQRDVLRGTRVGSLSGYNACGAAVETAILLHSVHVFDTRSSATTVIDHEAYN